MTIHTKDLSGAEIDALKGELKNVIDQVKVKLDAISTAEEARKAAFTQLQSEIKSGIPTARDTEDQLKRIATDQAKFMTELQGLRDTQDELAKRVDRPTGGRDLEDAETKSAIEYAQQVHNIKHRPSDNIEFDESKVDIDGYKTALRAFRKSLHVRHASDLQVVLTPDEQKALTTFAFSNNSFIIVPEMSSRIISCLEEQTDVTSLFDQIAISRPSIKMLRDDVEITGAAWGNETQCFANNPKADLVTDLGELEIKAETLRYSLCASREFLDDAEVDIQSWMENKVRDAFRRTISNALIRGDGAGKPKGILAPDALIPIMQVKPTGAGGAPAGQFTWQDLVALKYQVPMQYHNNLAYLMNQKTLGMILTMSDANSRPIWSQAPEAGGALRVMGEATRIVTQMPDVATGATPVAIGNWRETYTVVTRKAVSMQRDDYSAGFCVVFKFDARVGGDILCPNAARLMRIQ